MLLSILIPTLVERSALFERMRAALEDQIRACGAQSLVEVRSLTDNRERSTGEKRNLLVQQAMGTFTAFVDDDDRVSENYVSKILNAIEKDPGIDCIGIRGEITFRGKYTREFRHSVRYTDYSSKGGIYTRPPYHLNPIRRTIAAAYPFADVSYSEDVDWAMRLQRDHALQREVFIDSVLYYYDCRRDYRYQWLLDRTEGLRHSIGLRAANRLRLHPGHSAMAEKN